MERHSFTIHINAPREKVWEKLWNDDSYPQWTSAFAEGSKAESTWEEGSKIVFSGPDGAGMLAKIQKKLPGEYMSFRHYGMIRDGVEDTESEEVRPWAGAEENYTLRPAGAGTEVLVEMDMTDQYRDYFMETWPRALQLLKEISENNN